MSDVAIRVEGLGKRYRIGAQQRHDTLRDSIVDGLNRLKVGRLKVSKPDNGNLQPSTAQPSTEFWALRDVSFEVKRGEVVGIIGRNGAGKSTLLKILSRITEPTEGLAEIHGRVGSLLEVGTGFHPELTGRENIFLNGAILGMKRAEIAAKFDEIVAFSEIEKFLDTPVKRYSSGMYVRLAFAVAAHLEPEILLVDEVLAVGDQAFQSKCVGKMGDIAQQGRTVLFVSHNIPSVQHLCHQTILLGDGMLVSKGPTASIVTHYGRLLGAMARTGEASLTDHPRRRRGSQSLLQNIQLGKREEASTHFAMGEALQVTVLMSFTSPIADPNLRLAIENQYGQLITAFTTALQCPGLIPGSTGKKTISCTVPALRMLTGIYYITLIVSDGNHDLDWIDQAVKFEVQSADVYGTGRAPLPEHGVFYQSAEWSLVS